MKKLFILTLVVIYVHTASAQRRNEYTPSPVVGSAWNAPGNINPIIPGYFADPTIRKFGDTYYIYATTDGTGNGYGPAQVWMSKDFVNWKNFVMNWPTTEVVWAPDVVQQPSGKYRYYYCEPCNINIGESDSPIGPWHNILGKDDAVMVPDRYVHNVITLDPQLFTDDDGSQYLYFTTWGIYKGFGCGVAKLNDGDYDINTLATKYRDARHWNENRPYPIAADEFFSEKKLILNDELKDIFEAPFVFKKDGIYYFTYSSGSCHTDTYRVQYAISKTGPMGPFEYKGEILTTNEDGTVHGPGHHSILQEGGKYFIVYHRHNNPKSVHGFNRQVCIDKLEFDSNGDIKRITPTHDGINPLSEKMQKKAAKYKNLAYGAKVTCSSYYDEWFKPEYAVDDNNATLWKARGIAKNDPLNDDTRKLIVENPDKFGEWIQIDLGKPTKFTEIWTQFEYATFFYQYVILTSDDAKNWTIYSDRSGNLKQGSPMIDKGNTKARYIRIIITDTQKNGHMPAIWNVKVWKKAPELPETTVESNDGYPGMHKKDVAYRYTNKDDTPPSTFLSLDAETIGKTLNGPKDYEEIENRSSYMGTHSKGASLKANSPLRLRVKNGRWGFFFNGTQSLKAPFHLPDYMCYNAPYYIEAIVLPTKTGPVSTVLSLSRSHNDLATTEFNLGSDPATGLINHNGSFESYGAPKEIKENEGKWQHWFIAYDGWMEKVYLNGELIHSQNNFIMMRPNGEITIGSDGDGTNNFMGYISLLEVSSDYKSLRDDSPYLTDEDVKTIYEQRMLEAKNHPSLGDDDFEEIDPNSKFVLSANHKLIYESKESITLSANTGDFNESPLDNGAKIIKEVKGDFVLMATIEDMEGLTSHNVAGYNEGGILIADDDKYYQYGAFPLYNCGNMLTILSKRARPQFQNHKGYMFDQYIQFERKGNQLFARSSTDGKTWENNPGSPLTITSETLKLGIYQTTYSPTKSWVKLKDIKIYVQ